MSSKKYSMLLGLLSLTSVASFAQSSNSNDDWVFDSSKYSNSKLAQFNSFHSYATPYPAKPRSQWEFGIGVGPSLMFTPIDPKLGWGASASLRKALTNVFSVRAQYGYSIPKGLDFRTRGAQYAPTAVRNILASQGASSYLANYKAAIQQGSIDLIASLNTISNYRGNPIADIYVLAGYTYVWGSSRINLLNSSGGVYTQYSNDGAGANTSIDKDAAKDALSNGQDDGLFTMKGGNDQYYETLLTNRNGVHDNITGGGSQMRRHGADLGGGISFKLSKRFNIGLEQKFTWIFDNGDFSGVVTGPSQRNSLLSNTQVRFNFNIGSSKKAVEPLWWINPNNYVYSELNAPKHLKIPLVDSDGDGIADQLDQEPNTPAGAAVDAHGRALDTDGDGVPDYKDKQKLTPQSWFPVDADGVGTEPEPACCKELREKLANFKPAAETPECTVAGLPSISFKGNSVSLSTAAQASLATAAAQLNANPTCKVKVIGYGASNKKAQQLSWDRVNAVIKYLVERQGISESRVLFFYGQDGDAKTVDLQPTTEDGPNTVPAPHPNLQKTK